MKARGFVERSGLVICGGLPAAEMALLQSAVRLSQAEQGLLNGWQEPPSWDPATGEETDPPGRGKFLVKVGGRPGIPIDVQLTTAEKSLKDTNRLWQPAPTGLGALPGTPPPIPPTATHVPPAVPPASPPVPPTAPPTGL